MFPHSKNCSSFMLLILVIIFVVINYAKCGDTNDDTLASSAKQKRDVHRIILKSRKARNNRGTSRHPHRHHGEKNHHHIYDDSRESASYERGSDSLEASFEDNDYKNYYPRPRPQYKSHHKNHHKHPYEIEESRINPEWTPLHSKHSEEDYHSHKPRKSSKNKHHQHRHHSKKNHPQKRDKIIEITTPFPSKIQPLSFFEPSTQFYAPNEALNKKTYDSVELPITTNNNVLSYYPQYPPLMGYTTNRYEVNDQFANQDRFQPVQGDFQGLGPTSLNPAAPFYNAPKSEEESSSSEEVVTTKRPSRGKARHNSRKKHHD